MRTKVIAYFLLAIPVGLAFVGAAGALMGVW